MLSIKTIDLVKSFQVNESAATQTVIDCLSFQIEAGESVALMGPSGSGKSTLLNLIAGLEKPTSGRIFLGQQDVTSLSDAELEHTRLHSISYLFQFFHLLPTLTALENCALVALEQGKRSVSDIVEDARATLARLGLQGAEDKRPGQLSGGMLARTSLARALVARPQLILADEPTGNLDSKTGETVLDLLFEEQKRQKFTLLMVTHDASAAQRAQRIVRMRDGQLQS